MDIKKVSKELLQYGWESDDNRKEVVNFACSLIACLNNPEPNQKELMENDLNKLAGGNDSKVKKYDYTTEDMIGT